MSNRCPSGSSSSGPDLRRAATDATLGGIVVLLPRRVQHPTITRKVLSYHGRYYHVANLRGPDDLDDALRTWLTEAYFDSPT